MDFAQITFMLGLEVASPFHWKFKTFPGFHENLYRFRIGQGFKRSITNVFQSGNEFLIIHLLQEGQILFMPVKAFFQQFTQEFFGQDQHALKVHESHFRFDHPEFCQVTGCVGVLGTEGRPEGINIGEGQGEYLSTQLPGNGQTDIGSEKILVIIDLSVLGFWNLFQIKGGNVKHFTCPFGIIRGDDRGVDVKETPVLEKSMNRLAERIADTEHRS